MYMKVQGRPKSLHEGHGPALAARNPLVAGSEPQRLEHHPEKNLNDLGQHLRVVGQPDVTSGPMRRQFLFGESRPVNGPERHTRNSEPLAVMSCVIFPAGEIHEHTAL